MHRSSFLIAAIAALALALSPSMADARAGSGGSMGSRGSNTYSAPPATSTAPYSAAPMQRSLTPNSPAPTPGYGTPGYAPRPSFMSGMMGGLLGAGLIGMMFGGGLFGHGFGGFFGAILQIFLLVWLVRFVIRRFVRPSMPLTANGPAMFAPTGPGPMPMGGGRPPQAPIAIVPADYQAFEQLLKSIQAAWTVQDINALRALVTPEMLSYFAEQLAEQASRGVHNSVGDVRLLQGDLAEAWAEPGREYATVAMKFSMIDVTTDPSGRIVDGSPTEHVTATEIWTFLRSPGGHWILSAIQQAR